MIKCGYTEGSMLRMTQQRNILDAARHCRLAHVRQSSQAPPILTDSKAAADLVALTATKPLTAPPTSIGFGRPPPLTGLEILRRMQAAYSFTSFRSFMSSFGRNPTGSAT